MQNLGDRLNLRSQSVNVINSAMFVRHFEADRVS